MALFKGSTSRRREVRKTIAPRRRAIWTGELSRAQVGWGLALALVFAIGASWMVLSARVKPRYLPGQLVDRAVVSQVQFASVDPEKTRVAREEARRLTHSIYDRNTGVFDELAAGLKALPGIAAKSSSVAELTEEIRDRYGVKSDEMLVELGRFTVDGDTGEEWVRHVNDVMAALKSKALIPGDRYDKEKIRGMLLDLVIDPAKPGDIKFVGDLYKADNAKDITAAADAAIAEADRPRGSFPKVLGQVLRNYMLAHPRPLYTYNESRTITAQNAAVERVPDEPTTYAAGVVLVAAGKTFEEADYRIVSEHEKALAKRDGWVRNVGPIVLVLIIAAGYVVTVLTQRPRIAQNPMRGLALTALLLATLALVVVLRGAHPYALAAAAIGPALVTAVILTIAYDQRFAIAITALMTVLIALTLKLSVGIMLATVAACVAGILQLRELRQRGTLIRMGTFTAIVAGASVIGAALTERALVPDLHTALYAIGAEAGLASLACVVVGFFVLGVLPFIEQAFKVTTAMTLLELCDVNQPLLRQLAQKAPGTYNHSLQVGTLVEAACEAVGGDSLLGRVGAYYHDIGKMHKPQYFVENQSGGLNLHEKLSPAMSLLIIVGHVKDGIEMAREYGLPPQLLHFIESHHGTTLVEYFYHAARRQKGEKDQPEEIEFRYPGPKPATKEAAILMICDAVESACRTMSEPTAVRIEQLVDKIAMKRLMDGQFDHCDLTLAELELICESVTKSLCAIYHGRISYPSDREREALRAADARKAVAG